MPMPTELYHALNRAFSAAREAEKEATQLERAAEDARDRGHREVQVVYDLINAELSKLTAREDK